MKIDFVNPDLKFYFSFQCPYSYIAWTVLNKIVGETSIKVAPIEIGLEPSGKVRYHFRDLWSDERWEKLAEDASKLSIQLTRPTKIVSAISASRALQYFPLDETAAYVSSVFRAVFLTGIDISNKNKLRMHLQSESLDSSKFDDAQNDPSTLKRAEEQLLTWGHERVRMLPTLDNKGERYSGLIDAYGLERYIQDLLD